MPEQERIEIVKALKYADHVMLSVDTDGTVAETLKAITKQHEGEFIFAKGGDRNFDNLPENEKNVCRKFNVKVVNNVGGGKVQSSSWLLQKGINSASP